MCDFWAGERPIANCIPQGIFPDVDFGFHTSSCPLRFMCVKWCPVIGRLQAHHVTLEIWPEAESLDDLRRVSGFVSSFWQQFFNQDTPLLRSLFSSGRCCLSFNTTLSVRSLPESYLVPSRLYPPRSFSTRRFGAKPT